MMEEFTVHCHCGRVKGRFQCTIPEDDTIIAWDCDCSDCSLRQNVHIIVPERDFSAESSDEETILYQWGTKTAIRRFCKTCGVLPWYRPRSNPDGYAVTIYCVDWTKGGTRKPPNIRIEKFDGVNWEKQIQTMKDGDSKVNITEMSK